MDRKNSALDWAIKDLELPVRESNGTNRGPRIDALNRFVGNPFGSPYCAAGVSWCFHRAGADEFPFSGLARSIHEWFQRRGLSSRNPQDLLEWQGALFGWTLASGHGHIGFIEKRFTDSDGLVVAIGTVEYNTSPSGGRGRDGVYRRRRKAPAGGRMWFLRCDGFRGGAWWN